MSYRKFIAQDILTGADGLPLIENGDFVVAASDEQHINFITQSNKGDFRFQPLVGCNLSDFLNAVAANTNLELKQRITAQLNNDGYKINSLSLIEEQAGQVGIMINANRIS
jgi:hypothetical protein